MSRKPKARSRQRTPVSAAKQIDAIRKQIETVAAAQPPRWNANPEEVRRAVLKLVLTLVELIRQLLERQAIRRMEAGTLTDDETENVGLALMNLQDTIHDLAKQFDIPPEELNLDLGPVGKPVRVQPLSALAYAAANAHTVLAQRPDVDPQRIGIVGHSFGGKWAMFASCLYDKFACAVWSDPGIVFDERDRRKQNPSGSVNYWDVWYLGSELGAIADPKKVGPFRKLPSEGQPRTGAYKALVEGGYDLVELHALMAPRPFLVSGGTADLPERWPALNHAIAVNQLLGYRNRVGLTTRDGHSPTQASNEQVYHFFEWCLGR